MEVKRATGVTFILVGDFRQCPAVENDGLADYFNHPAVKYLVNYNLCDLTVRKRYDKELWDMLEDVNNNVDTTKFGNQICTKNISYFNKTRQYVNTMLMLKCKPDDAHFVERDVDDEHSQDIWVYKGLPLMAHENVGKGVKMVNNEYFILEDIQDGVATCVSERPTGMHRVKWAVKDLQKVMYVNYCTTVHKSQGETIHEDFTIWDWKRMHTKLKYTAMSRAKLPSQINFKIFPPSSDLPPEIKPLIARKIQDHL